MDIADLRINSERLRADFDEISEIGATVAGGVSRLALSNEDLEARAWFANKIEETGLRVTDDDAGNLGGALLSLNPHAKTLIMGSHLDSVPNGGRFDGTIGVLAALECLRVIKESGVMLPLNLEVVDFTDQEGNWQGMFGSMGMTGRLTPSHINDATEDHGAFRAALFRAGIRPADVTKARRDPATVVGFLELHIEQGCRLENAGIHIGNVTTIVGRTTYHIIFQGEAAHAATTAMDDRRDALQGAARFVLEAHKLIQEQYNQGVFNCGNIEVDPGSFNIIPQRACLTVEVRHPDEEVVTEMESTIIKLAQDLAAAHRLKASAKRIIHRAAANMHPQAIAAIKQACASVGAESMPIISYAGHDAQMLSSFTPSGMIFVPSVQGISHNPREFTRWEHVEIGANVLLHAALNMVKTHAPDG